MRHQAFWLWAVVLTAFTSHANAQVLQTGSVTPGHVAQWATNGVIQDGGKLSGGGTVTSVGLTAPSWLTVAGSPVTTSGTLALTGTSESANLFLASPNGSSGVMTPRALVAADIPLANTDFLVGNASGMAAPVAMSGSCSLANTGAVTCELGGSSLQTFTLTGNTTKLATSTGTLTNTHCVEIDASGNFVDAGGACTTGGGGGTVTSGTGPAIGQYPAGTGTTIGPATVSGDATIAQGGAITIANNAITNAKTAQMTANTVKGNFTGSTANAADNAVPSCSSANQALNYTSGTGLGCVTISPGTGTVTSVAETVPTGFTISGSPVTTSGTLAIGLSAESANTVWAGPTTGSAAAPGFRALVGADLPNPSATTLGGVESIATVTHNFLTTISTAGVPSAAQPAFTDLSGSASAAQMATNLSAALDSAFGSAQGDILYRDSAAWQVLAPGTSGFFLKTQGAASNPVWAAVSAGSGCTTSGTSGDLLTDDGAGGCASQADWILSSNQLLGTKNAAVTSPSAFSTLLSIAGADNATDGVQVLTFAAAAGPQFTGSAALGTGASKSTVTNNTVLASFNGAGFDGSAYSGVSGAMRCRASETWSGTAHGTKCAFSITPNTTTTLTQAGVFENDGTLFVGSDNSSTTHNTGAGSINAATGYFIDHSGSPAALAIGDLAPVTGPVIAGRVTATSGAMSTPYTPSNGTDTTVAMAHSAFTAGDGVKANDTTGTIVDSGAAVGLTHFDIGYIAGVNMTTNPTEVSIALPVGMTISSMVGHVGAAVGGTATIDIYEAPSGTACASGTKLTNTTNFNANGTANTDQTLAGTTSTITSGDRLCLVAAGAGWSSSVGSGGITVWAHL